MQESVQSTPRQRPGTGRPAEGCGVPRRCLWQLCNLRRASGKLWPPSDYWLRAMQAAGPPGSPGSRLPYPCHL